MKLPSSAAKTFFVLAFFVFVQSALAQTDDRQKLSRLDQEIQAGFDSLKAKKWSNAALSFEEALKIFDKETDSSGLLFTLFTLPDEDPSAPPEDQTEKQIITYRHAMATRQALLQFLSYAYQLNGNSAQAEKYDRAVYEMRGPLWGLSWEIFAPRFYKVFNDLVQNEKGENFGRFQYLAALLLTEAGEDSATTLDLLQKARQNAPRDADIPAHLANRFLQKREPKEAKKQAELSLSLKPAQKSVLIDLSTAEWLLGEFDNSIKHAEEAARIDRELPGPRMLLALNYIEKKDFPRALKEAAAAVDLSRRHPFYLTVQAAAFEAAGDGKEAEKLLLEAWEQKLPNYDDLDAWYINKTLRDLVLKIAARLDKSKTDT